MPHLFKKETSEQISVCLLSTTTTAKLIACTNDQQI